MNIRQVNDNVLREAEYTLKVIDGTKAEVYTDTYDNLDLNTFGYWEEFLRNADFITLPLISIDSMEKTQSIWYRNKPTIDVCNIKVSNDYENNIVEFMNKGIKHKNLDFDNLEQLIFIIEVEFINSVGWVSRKPLFVGRPEIATDTETVLAFNIKALDDIISDSFFNTNVLKANTGSFYSFLNLKQAFERIYNTPHDKDDNYSYPVQPFVINEENYIEETNGGTYLNENSIIPATYNTYAEDFVEGNENIKQIFFYRDTPECGITSIKTDNNGNIIAIIGTDYLNGFRYYTNPDELDNVDSSSVLYKHKKIVDNVFRSFRPIQTFISKETMINMSVAEINGQSINLLPASNEEFRVDIGDEIIIMEQKFDFIKLQDKSNWKSIVMCTCTSNVMFYNKTKDIMYWNNVLKQVCSPPLPPLFLDCRLEGYFDLKIEWDTHYGTSQQSGVESILYLERHYVPSNEIVLNSTLLGRPDQLRIARQYNITVPTNTYISYVDFSLRSDMNIGYQQSTGLKFVLNPNDDLPLEVVGKLERITRIKPKPIRFLDNKLLFVYQRINNNTKIVVGAEDWNTSCSMNVYADFNDKLYTEYLTVQSPNGSLNGIVIDIPRKTLGEDFIINQYIFDNGQTAFDLNSEHMYTLLPFLDEAVLFQQGSFDNNYETKPFPTIQFNYLSFNGSSSLPANYFFIQNVGFEGVIIDTDIWFYNGQSKAIIKTYDNSKTILDINSNIDKVIYVDANGYLTYANISDDTIIFQDQNLNYTKYLLTTMRTSVYFVDTNNDSTFQNVQEDFKVPVRLLAFNDSRYMSAQGLANSFLKNSYNNNLGVKYIGIEQPETITLDDSMISNINVKTYTYNKIEYSKYNFAKNVFTDIDNDDAESTDARDTDYDEALSVNIYSNVDVDLEILLTRTAIGIDYSVSNEFGTNTGSFVPPSYSSFDFSLTGDFSGITLYVNFFDAELEVSKSFRGQIDKQELIESKIKDVVEGSENKLIWKDDNTLGLKFPFLYDKYSTTFNNVLGEYWKTEDNNFRKLIVVDITINELILFNENYTIFNVGEKRIIIDSKCKYLNGYDFDINGDLTPFNNNKASFYIEKVKYSFKTKRTTFRLVSI